jgi:hypothetical protein
MRNRVTVLASWLWAYLTFRRGSRLITGSGPLTRALSLTTPGGDSKQRSASLAGELEKFRVHYVDHRESNSHVTGHNYYLQEYLPGK